MLGILAVLILTVYFAWVSWTRLKFCQILSIVPGPKSWPVVGNALQFDRTPQGKCSFILFIIFLPITLP